MKTNSILTSAKNFLGEYFEICDEHSLQDTSEPILPLWAVILIGIVIVWALISGAVEIFNCLCGDPKSIFSITGDSYWLDKF